MCGNTDLACLVDFGSMPLANSFLGSPDEFRSERFFPLRLFFCPNCGLVQVLDVIDPEVLFRDYIYLTGTSDTMAQHNVDYARTVVSRFGLTAEHLVVEVASNDGSLLGCFKSHNVKVLGIEPAGNIARIANQKGVTTDSTFFNLAGSAAIRQQYGLASVVIGNNVLAHVDEPLDFLLGMKNLLESKGVVIVEVPYLKEMIDRLEYDTVYHEHLSYFSLLSLTRLFEKAGLSIIQVEFMPVHGGSLRLYAGHREVHPAHARSVADLVDQERQAGMAELDNFLDFAARVEQNRSNLVGLLENLNLEGKRVVGYGAPAKGNTLLNYCQISTRLLPFTVDKNPLKLGKFTPGMHLPVLPVESLLESQPDYVLVLAWNFSQEIMRQQELYLQRGGRFILPIPEPRVIQ